MLAVPNPAPRHSGGGPERAPSAKELHPPRASDVRQAHASRFVDVGQARQQIDRAVGLALFDQTPANQLVANPPLAVKGNVCGQRQYVALRQIRARDLQNFARQVFDQFLGPAHPLSTCRWITQ